MGELQRSAFDVEPDEAQQPQVRFAGQPVPVGRSPWEQPPRKLARASAPGVYQTRPPADGAQSAVLRPRTLAESLARDFGGVRQITIANPAPGSGKTRAVNALHAVFREARSDVVAWDADGLGDADFARERDRLGRSYRVLIVDTTAAPQPALDATDQLVVALGTHLESVRAAEEMLSGLEASDQAPLARNAIVVITTGDFAGGSGHSNQTAATAQRFSGRTRAIFASSPSAHSGAATDEWNRIAQAVAGGL